MSSEAERVDIERVFSDLKKVGDNPVADSLLTCVGGLLAIINEKRQIMTPNGTLLRNLGAHGLEKVPGGQVKTYAPLKTELFLPFSFL